MTLSDAFLFIQVVRSFPLHTHTLTCVCDIVLLILLIK